MKIILGINTKIAKIFMSVSPKPNVYPADKCLKKTQINDGINLYISRINDT